MSQTNDELERRIDALEAAFVALAGRESECLSAPPPPSAPPADVENATVEEIREHSRDLAQSALDAAKHHASVCLGQLGGAPAVPSREGFTKQQLLDAALDAADRAKELERQRDAARSALYTLIEDVRVNVLSLSERTPAIDLLCRREAMKNASENARRVLEPGITGPQLASASISAAKRIDAHAEALRSVLGHSNCYCATCKDLAALYWHPLPGDRRLL
jgi:cell division septum initiation protein DivIVA